MDKCVTSEIVWIYGASAVGKETFIKKISDGKLPHIINEFNWNRKIVVCEESIDWVRLDPNDGKAEKRIRLPRIIARLAKPGSIVFIKGQSVDLENNSLNKLINLLPNTEHSIIFLHAPLKDLYIRCQRKIWWNPKYTFKMMKGWLVYEISLLLKLNNKIMITGLRADGDQYRVIKFPPQI